MKPSSPSSPPAKRANGRPRKNPELGLPKRVQLRSGTFYYVHASTGKWENLGKDLGHAEKLAEAYNDGQPLYGTMSYWLDEWKLELDKQVTAKELKPRSRDDYVKAFPYLKPFFGSMHPKNIESHHVQEYLDIGRDLERPIRANREKAALSSCMTWMLSRNHGGLKVNICLAVPRNPETPRDRYISNEEYKKVLEKCTLVARVYLELIFRTLQRPSDILSWTRSKNFVVENGVELLSFRQSKTNALVKIIVTPSLHDLFDSLRADREARGVRSDFLVHKENGGQYTLDGITSIVSRYIAESGVADMAPYDMKAKGATDMYTAKVPLETICSLCAHDSVTTTERYVKRHQHSAVAPNASTIEMPKSAPVERKTRKRKLEQQLPV